MEIQNNFKFLNYEVINRKDGKGQFVKLNLLDGNMTPVVFFSFKDELSNKIRNIKFNPLQDLLVKFSLTYNNTWRVDLIDIILKSDNIKFTNERSFFMSAEVTNALNTVGTTLNGSISPADVASIIGIVLAGGIALYLTWFGIRKLISVVKNAMKGRLKV